MAKIDDLISRVGDPQLRADIRDAVVELRSSRNFGLVFEEHIPELATMTTVLPRTGSTVRVRNEDDNTLYRVMNIEAGRASLALENGRIGHTVPVEDLHVVRRFGEPVFPALISIGSIKREDSSPYHTVINGENYHTLQLLSFLYAGKVDCIYIDPPYNTGAKDWTYNNQYVDTKDAWRHSKWLSFMEKRLRLAKRLLSPDGVLIVTIDEHEVHHLGMLLERLFPAYVRQMITIVNNPKGTNKANFKRVEEYAIFCCPDIGRSVLSESPVAQVAREENSENGTISLPFIEGGHRDDGDTESEDDLEPSVAEDFDDPPLVDPEYEYRHLRRRGTESSYRAKRKNQFYPIYVNPDTGRPIRTGASLDLATEPDFSHVDGLKPLYPIDKEGLHRVWAYVSEVMQRRIDAGDVITGKYHKDNDTWTLNLRVPKVKSQYSCKKGRRHGLGSGRLLG